MGSAAAVALAGGASQVVKATPVKYVGYAIRELAGTTAVFRLWDNVSAASGTIVDVISLAANESRSIALAYPVVVANGLFLERVSGTTYEGSIRIG